MPVITKTMPAIFAGLSASPNSATPMISVPAAPMPVHTA